MVGEPPTPRRMVVAIGERTSAWRRMVSLPDSGFLLGVYRGMAHLMVVSLVGVEVVAGKVHWKIFQQRQGVLTAMEGVETFYDEGGIAGKGLIH